MASTLLLSPFCIGQESGTRNVEGSVNKRWKRDFSGQRMCMNIAELSENSTLAPSGKFPGTSLDFYFFFGTRIFQHMKHLDNALLLMENIQLFLSEHSS